MFDILCPRNVVEVRVSLKHLIEKALALPEKLLADLKEQWRGEHPWDTHLALLAPYPEDAHHVTIQENGTVVVASEVGLPKSHFRRHTGQVPDLVTVLLPHGDTEFSDITEVGRTDFDVIWPDYV